METTSIQDCLSFIIDNNDDKKCLKAFKLLFKLFEK